jgi:hypothetical protein
VGRSLRAVSPAAVKNVCASSTPDDHLVTGPDGVILSAGRGVGGARGRPIISAGIISSAKAGI